MCSCNFYLPIQGPIAYDRTMAEGSRLSAPLEPATSICVTTPLSRRQTRDLPPLSAIRKKDHSAQNEIRLKDAGKQIFSLLKLELFRRSAGVYILNELECRWTAILSVSVSFLIFQTIMDPSAE
jgi:hypothetical protein